MRRQLDRIGSPSAWRRRRSPRLRPVLDALEGRRLLASFRVTNGSDGGGGSLRAAVEAANAQPGADTITFAPGVSAVTLTTDQLRLTDDATIAGPLGGTVRIARSSAAGTPQFRILEVLSGVQATLENLTIAGGHAVSGGVTGSDGGGISNAGTLRVASCTIVGNRAGDGSASAGVGGNVTARGGRGGGIFNAGTLTMTASAVVDNRGGDGTATATANGLGRGDIIGNGGGGGGISNVGGTLAITGCVISSNRAGVSSATGNFFHAVTGQGGSGGGISNIDGTVTVTSSTLAGNHAGDAFATGNSNPLVGDGGYLEDDGGVVGVGGGGGGDGGGIFSLRGMVSVTSSTFANNRAGDGVASSDFSSMNVNGNGGNGGAIADVAGSLTVTFSTLSGNRAGDGLVPADYNQFSGAEGGRGGGVVAAGGGSVTISSTTISGNRAGDASVTGDGNSYATSFGGDEGALSFLTEVVTITSSTVFGNSAGLAFVSGDGTFMVEIADGRFGGISGSVPAVQIQNTIVAGSLPTGSDLIGNFTGSHNLVQGGGGGLDPSTNLLGVDPRLGPLSDNGGPTLTHALLTGSPAIDAGDDMLLPDGLAFDQRGPGFARIQGDRVDIGAFELQVPDTEAPRVLSYQVLYGEGRSYDLLTGTGRVLPWRVTGIRAVFSEPIAAGSAASLGGLSATSVTGLGTDTLTWAVATLTNGTFATTLAGSGDAALKDAAGNPLGGGSGFARTFRVLYGDYNGDGFVGAADMSGVNVATARAYDPFADLDGDGDVDFEDVRSARSRIGARLAR